MIDLIQRNAVLLDGRKGLVLGIDAGWLVKVAPRLVAKARNEIVLGNVWSSPL